MKMIQKKENKKNLVWDNSSFAPDATYVFRVLWHSNLEFLVHNKKIHTITKYTYIFT